MLSFEKFSPYLQSALEKITRERNTSLRRSARSAASATAAASVSKSGLQSWRFGREHGEAVRIGKKHGADGAGGWSSH